MTRLCFAKERCGLFLSEWNQASGNETLRGEKEMAWNKTRLLAF